MASEGVSVDDTDVKRALNRLADSTRDLSTPHQVAGELLLERATPKTPRESGRLAASGRVRADSDETDITYDEVYAGVIHNGWEAHNIEPQPWLAETLGESTAAVTGVFLDYFEDSLRRI